MFNHLIRRNKGSERGERFLMVKTNKGNGVIVITNLFVYKRTIFALMYITEFRIFKGPLIKLNVLILEVSGFLSDIFRKQESSNIHIVSCVGMLYFF